MALQSETKVDNNSMGRTLALNLTNIILLSRTALQTNVCELSALQVESHNNSPLRIEIMV